MVSVSSETSAVLVTGIQAAGKSTVGRMLCERFDRGAFVEGDLMWKLVVAGRVDMTPNPSAEALEQLNLRYRNGARLVDSLTAAGFSTVHVDIILGDSLRRYREWVQFRPLRIVVLTPDPRSVVERELGRGTHAYRDWISEGSSLDDAVNEFQRWVVSTPSLGIRIDSTSQTPEETVDEILDRWDEAVI